MRFEDLIVDSQALEAIRRRYGIRRLEVFGSFARGDARSDSDLDLLVSLAPDACPGWEIAALHTALMELFDRPIDLLERSVVEADPNPWFRRSVLSEARVVDDATAA